MESVGLKISIYFLIFVEISNWKNAVYFICIHLHLIDCILTLCIPRIKSTLKVIQEVHRFLLTAKKSIKSRNFMPVAEKLAKIAIKLALATDYLEGVSDFGFHDVNVSLLQLVKPNLNFFINN